MFTFFPEQFSKLIQGSLFYKTNKKRYVRFRHVAIDSRQYNANDIFFTIVGKRNDAHLFFNHIFHNPTSAVVSNLAYINYPIHENVQFLYHVKDTQKALYNFAKFWRYEHPVETIAVSGSCGKTTIKQMLFHVLKQYYPTICNPGNYNSAIGCPLSILQIRKWHRYGIFEIGGSELGNVDYLSHIVKPSIAVVSTIGLEHMETFSTIENVIHTETESFSHLPHGGTAVIPRDSFAYKQLLKRVPQNCSVITFGCHPDSDVQLVSYQCDYMCRRSTIVIDLFSFPHKITVPIINRFNIINFLSVIATCTLLGMQMSYIQHAFDNFRFDFGRFQIYELKNRNFIIDDSYNSNPHSMEISMIDFNHTFVNLTQYLCIGDMLSLGDISIQEHIRLGVKIEKLNIAGVFFYGDLIRHTYTYLKQNKTKKTILFFHDKNTLSQFFKNHFSNQNEIAILFKCSNDVGLHSIVQDIVDSDQIL